MEQGVLTALPHNSGGHGSDTGQLQQVGSGRLMRSCSERAGLDSKIASRREKLRGEEIRFRGQLVLWHLTWGVTGMQA